MSKTIKWFLISFITVIIIGYLIYLWETPMKPEVDKKLIPTINKNPKYFFDVLVHVDNYILTKSPVITITMGYQSNNPKCKKIINKLEGAYTPREKLIKRTATLNQNGNYHHKFVIDKFLPGHCNWQPAGIGYDISNTNFSATIIRFSNESISNNKVTSAYDTISCDNKMDCKYDPKQSKYFKGSFINPTGNYKYQLNIKQKG